MSRLAHPHAMAPAKPGPTRTAPPRMPPEFPLRGRYRAYTLFDASGAIYLLLGLLALRLVWALPGMYSSRAARLSETMRTWEVRWTT